MTDDSTPGREAESVSDVIQLDPQKVARPRTNLDVISLEQALRDFEVANARVVDLTRRLLESERRRTEIANELEQFKLQGGIPRQQSAPPSSAQPSPISRIAKRVARKLVREVSRRFVK